MSKTITVTDVQGRQTRLGADEWDVEDGEITVKNSGIGDDPVCAVFALGQWVSAVDDSRRAPDGASRALAAAKRGLTEIIDEISAAGHDNLADANTSLDKLRGLAEAALDEIYAETEA